MQSTSGTSWPSVLSASEAQANVNNEIYTLVENSGVAPAAAASIAFSPFLHETSVDTGELSTEPKDAMGSQQKRLEKEGSRPSNEKLLGTAFVSFMSFALVQMVFAFIAGSQAMVGDSTAMLVDAMTYFFNWIAERRKNRLNVDPLTVTCMQRRMLERTKRRVILQLEIVPPLFSVTTLVVVTVLVFHKAIETLHLELLSAGHLTNEKDPNMNIMMAFSLVNLMLDFLNVFCFARARHAFGFRTQESHSWKGLASNEGKLDENLQLTDESSEDNDDESTVLEIETHAFQEKETSARNHFRRPENAPRLESHHDSEEANLNMCSACTHVLADTLRSTAVVVAVAVNKLFPRVTPEVADSSAAVVVSILIALSIIPLFQGIYWSVVELHEIRREEKMEALLKTREENSCKSRLSKPGIC